MSKNKNLLNSFQKKKDKKKAVEKAGCRKPKGNGIKEGCCAGGFVFMP